MSFSKPKMPATPPPTPPRPMDPPPPVEPASATGEDVSRRAQQAADELRQRRGRASTILTAGGGDGGPVPVAIPGLSGGNRQTMG